jgi:acyl-CoA synthetase (NDP forming)
MTTKAAVDYFLSRRTWAVAGASRAPKTFGGAAYRELKKTYRLAPVNPQADRVDGDRCYPDLLSLPEPVDGALILVPPSQTEQVVRDAHAAGIPAGLGAAAHRIRGGHPVLPRERHERGPW